MFAKITLFVAAFVVTATSAIAQDRHQAVSAHAAQVALTRHAVVLDVRDAPSFAAAHLPGSVSIPFAQTLGDSALAASLSTAGVDLSREVLLVGDAGCPAAHALHQRLSAVASGRVLWLVGSLQEWLAVGAPTAQGAAISRLPVPQHLVALPAGALAEPVKTMAAAQRQSAATDSQTPNLYSFARLY